MTDSVTAMTDDEPSADTEGPIGSPTKVHRVSPWPPLVALGFAVSEIGIVLNLVPLSIGGIVLFGGSVAGILSETAYVASPWRTLSILGALFVALGALVWTSQVAQIAVGPLLEAAATDAIAMRGQAIVVGGIVLLVGAIGGAARKPLSTEAKP